MPSQVSRWTSSCAGIHIACIHSSCNIIVSHTTAYSVANTLGSRERINFPVILMLPVGFQFGSGHEIKVCTHVTQKCAVPLACFFLVQCDTLFSPKAFTCVCVQSKSLKCRTPLLPLFSNPKVRELYRIHSIIWTLVYLFCKVVHHIQWIQRPVIVLTLLLIVLIFLNLV